MKYLITLSLVGLSGCGHGGGQGPSGPQGNPGSQGNGCIVTAEAASTVVPYGGSLITCGDTTSLVLNGSPGGSGVTVSAVQFCAGANTSYPSTFPEVGFCLGNELYGVYSAHDGFLTPLPPGTYTSNGINASCTFTVTSGCNVVTQ